MNNPTIFMVDDCAINHLFFKLFVNTLEPNVSLQTFLDPTLALKHLALEEEPLLIILDINMPKITGWQFMDRIQEYKVKHRVIIASSSKTESDLQKAEEYDAIIDYFSKPFNKSRIQNVLMQQLNQLAISA